MPPFPPLPASIELVFDTVNFIVEGVRRRYLLFRFRNGAPPVLGPFVPESVRWCCPNGGEIRRSKNMHMSEEQYRALAILLHMYKGETFYYFDFQRFGVSMPHKYVVTHGGGGEVDKGYDDIICVSTPVNSKYPTGTQNTMYSCGRRYRTSAQELNISLVDALWQDNLAADDAIGTKYFDERDQPTRERGPKPRCIDGSIYPLPH